MDKRRPTLHDVSAAAGVSTFAASRALSGGGGVSDTTRARVQQAAAALGYVPNQHARNLKGSRSQAVAVLTANLANHYYAALVDGLASALEPEGYDCLTMDALQDGGYSQSREDRYVAALRAQRVAAVVVTYQLSAANMAALSDWGVPLLFVDCPAPEGFGHYPSVLTDNYQGSLAMGLHLASHGLRRWAFVGHTATWASRGPRQAGFEAAAAQTGSTVEVIEGSNASAAAQAAVTRHLVQRPRRDWPQALYASNTVLLHGTLQALRQLGAAVPADIAVVAFDDFDWAELVDPPITVVDQDITTIGRTAGTLLLRALTPAAATAGGAPGEAVGEPVAESVMLRPTLRIRASCGCGRPAGGPSP